MTNSEAAKSPEGANIRMSSRRELLSGRWAPCRGRSARWEGCHRFVGLRLLAALLLSHQLGDGNARIPRIAELYIFFGEARRDLLECVKSHFLRTRSTLLKSLTFGNLRLCFAISTSKSVGKRAFRFGKMRWNLCSHLYFSRKDVVVIPWKQMI